MKRISRRAALRGLGVSVALPFLEVMGRAESAAAPQRAAFIYIPNGVHLENWFPRTTGREFEITPTLAPLRAFRDEIAILGGMDRTYVAGTGVHAQSGACWLTSSPPSERLDGGFPTNISLDQILARRPGTRTLLPSLELSCNDHADNRETKYFESISWYGPGHAANTEKNPRSVFSRLFGRNQESPITRSVLDVVLDQARALRTDLGIDDRRKLDEYLESVRSTESRIQAAERASERRIDPPIPEPEGIPAQRGDYLRLMADLMVLAFQQDLTRVATLLVDPERWDAPRMYHGVFDRPQNHHGLTHSKLADAKEKLARIDLFHMEQFAYLLERMKRVREGEGTLLDNSAVVIGSGMSNGDLHSYKDLPVIVAGRAGGRLRSGFFHNFPGEVPLANLWLTIARAFGVELPRFADSTGVIAPLQAS